MHAFFAAVICACSSGCMAATASSSSTLKLEVFIRWKQFMPICTSTCTHIYTVRKRLLNLTCVGVGIFKPFHKLISTCSLVVKKSWIQCALTAYQAGWKSFKYVQSSQLFQLMKWTDVRRSTQTHTHAQSHRRKSYNLRALFSCVSLFPSYNMLRNTLWITE